MIIATQVGFVLSGTTWLHGGAVPDTYLLRLKTKRCLLLSISRAAEPPEGGFMPNKVSRRFSRERMVIKDATTDYLP